jgi:hypothetical protein
MLANGWRRQRVDLPLTRPGVCKAFSDHRTNDESLECTSAADCLPAERCCTGRSGTYCQGHCDNEVACRSNADCAGILVHENLGWGEFRPSRCVPCGVPGVKCCALPTWWDWPP